MKKVILTLTIALMAFCVSAQKKSATDTTKKVSEVKTVPEFKLDPTKIYTITLHLSSQESFVMGIDPDRWKEAIRHNPQFNGAQIGNIEDAHERIRKQINFKVDSLIILDYKHWQQDSIKIARHQ